MHHEIKTYVSIQCNPNKVTIQTQIDSVLESIKLQKQRLAVYVAYTPKSIDEVDDLLATLVEIFDNLDYEYERLFSYYAALNGLETYPDENKEES